MESVDIPPKRSLAPVNISIFKYKGVEFSVLGWATRKLEFTRRGRVTEIWSICERGWNGDRYKEIGNSGRCDLYLCGHPVGGVLAFNAPDSRVE